MLREGSPHYAMHITSSSVLWRISEVVALCMGGVGRFVVGVFGRCICVLIGECGLVCVVDGVWCML